MTRARNDAATRTLDGWKQRAADAGGLSSEELSEMFSDMERALSLRDADDARREVIATSGRDPALLVRREDGRILDANPAATECYGYSRAELLRLTIGDLRAPHERGGGSDHPMRANATGSFFEAVHQRKDGTTFPVEVSARGANVGNERSVVQVVRDLSARKRTDDALRRGAAFLKQTQAVSKIGGWEYDSGTGHIEWTDEVYRIYDVEPDEYAPDDVAHSLAFYAPEDRTTIDQAFRRAVEHGESYDLELGFVSAKGRRKWVRTIGEAERVNGKVVRVFGHIADITEHREAQDQLSASEKRYRRIFDAAPWAIALTDAETRRFIDANPAAERLLGYSKQELLALGLAAVTVDPEAVEQALSRLAEGEDVRTPVRSVRRKDGTVFPAELEAGTFELGGRQVFFSLFHDITERERAEVALREADRNKTAFLAMLSHELRNPLTPIRNCVYLLKGATLDLRGQRAVETIDRQLSHVVSLVDDLLDIARITRGKVRLWRTRLDLVAVVRRCVDDHRSILAGRQVRLDIPDAEVWVDGDAARLAQVIGNLLSNAAKFTPAGGEISVSLRCAEDAAVLEVADTGVGMEPEMLSRVFEPFTQADRSIDRSAGGLGLGLALVKGHVEQHGGTVRAQSDGVGRGARFTVTLPLDEHEVAAPLAPGSVRALQDAPETRVLVIEDNEDAADTLRDVLERAGHEVSVAYSGTDGIAEAKRFHPDVILCDIGLPGMDGYDVARTLRHDDDLGRSFLVALTGYGQPEDQEKALLAGFDAHMTKPPVLEVLTRLIARACGPSAP